MILNTNNKYETATFGGGCFWCTEAIFKRVNGVISVMPGYSGGKVPNPDYESVTTGMTGHAEVIQLQFNPKILEYTQLLDIFFALHDPTTKDRQGQDIGTQYRSVIFYHNETQKNQAENTIKNLQDKHIYKKPIMTELIPYTRLYSAEEYHMNYYDSNPTLPYCSIVIKPKIKKLIEKYNKLIKKEYLKS